MYTLRRLTRAGASNDIPATMFVTESAANEVSMNAMKRKILIMAAIDITRLAWWTGTRISRSVP